MRARVVSLRDIHEKYGAEVKQFTPAFVIPRRFPGWDTMEQAATGGPVFRPVFPDGPVLPDGKQPRYIEVKRRA